MKLDQIELLFNSYYFHNPDPTDFNFFFTKKDKPVDDTIKKKSIWIVLLVCGIVIMSILILLAILSIMVLFRDRKKALLSQNMTVDETEIDISYI